MALSPQERSRRMRLNMLMAMSYAVAGRSTFTPLSLFSAGEVGAWYDPSDFSTMFQDAAGTTPVTAVEQPVGLILDKSKSLAIGPELVTNGTFDSNLSGWTVGSDSAQVIPTWTSSGVSLTRGTGGTAGFSQNIGMTVGKWYALSFNLVSGNVTIGGFTGSSTLTTLGQQTRYYVANSNTIQLWPTNLSSTVVIDNISVKEIAGNHASQTTSTSRPVLSARVNLLTNTEDFSAASWTKNRASIGQNTTATTDPSGGNTADKIIEDSTASNNHRIYASVQLVSGVAYTYRCYAKAAERTQVLLNVVGVPNSGCYFNLANGTVGTADSGVTGSISNAGNGWYLCTVSFTSGTTGGNGPGISIAVSGSDTYTGDGASGIYVWGADFRVTNSGTGLPPYQRVGAATAGSSSAAGTGDYDTTGFPYYLAFDGTDDFLVTGTINPGSVDKAQVFAGVRKLSDAAAAVVAELSVNRNTNNGAFALVAPGAAAANYAFGSKGTNDSFQSVTTYTAPITNVVTGIGDIANDVNIIRVNGTEVASASIDQGTGNFLSYAMYIGRRGGTTLPYNGRLYGLIVRFSAANLSSDTITKAETWMNTKTGAY